jgi:hypothetical protein
MATKNVSTIGFWVILLGGGFVIVLLAAWSLYTQPASPLRLTQNSRGTMGSVTVGNAGYAVAPMAPEYYDKASAGADSFMPSPVPPPVSGGDTAATATPRIIKTGSLSLEVKSSRESAEQVSTIASSQGGFVEASNIIDNNDGTVSAYATIRVPADKFDATLAALRALALRVSSESVNGQDVTEQYTDLEARLANARAQEAQYLEILKKATSVQDILAVQQYLSQVRYEIESLQGQIKYLGNKTEYSTISVTLQEQANLNIPSGKFDLIRDMKQAGQAVILLFQGFLTFAIWFVIIGSAVAIPLAVFFYVLYRTLRKFLMSK